MNPPDPAEIGRWIDAAERLARKEGSRLLCLDSARRRRLLARAALEELRAEGRIGFGGYGLDA